MIDNHNTPPSKDGEEKDPLFDKQLSDLSRRVTLEVPAHIRELVLEDALKTLLPLDMPLQKTVMVPPDNVWRRWGLGMGLAASVMLGLNVFWQVESTAPGSLTQPVEPKKLDLPANPKPALPQPQAVSKDTSSSLAIPSSEQTSLAAKPKPVKPSKPLEIAGKIGTRGSPFPESTTRQTDDKDYDTREQPDEILMSAPSPRSEPASVPDEENSSEFKWKHSHMRLFVDMENRLKKEAVAQEHQQHSYASKRKTDSLVYDEPSDTPEQVKMVYIKPNQWAGEPVKSVQTEDGFKISGWRYWPVYSDWSPKDPQWVVAVVHQNEPNPHDLVLDKQAIKALIMQKDIANSPLTRTVNFEGTCKSATCTDEQELFSQQAMELDKAKGNLPWMLMEYLKSK